MSRGLYVLATLCLALGGVLSPPARADVWNKKTVVTIPEPVEVPGAVLQPGTYVFKLVDSPSNRHIVRIMNEDENHVYTTTLAIPNYRREPADKTVLTFYEMPGDRPQALRAWFYPGDNFGQEFAYPKAKAAQIASATKLQVPVAPEAEAAPAAEAPRTAAAKEPEPEATVPGEPPRAEAQSAAADPPARATVDGTAKPEPTGEAKPVELPATASDLPLMGLLGLVSLSGAVALRILARRRG